MNETNLRRILIEGFGDTAAARKQLILRFSFRRPIWIHIPVMTGDSLFSAAKKRSPRFSQVLLFWLKLSRRTLSPLHWNLFTFTMKPPICIKLLSPSSLFDKYLDITSMAVYINIPVVLVATWANTFNFMTCSAVNLWWHKNCQTCEAQT